MKSMNMKSDEAISFIRERRRGACPNENFRNQLKLYENMGCQLQKTTQNKKHYKEYKQMMKQHKKRQEQKKDPKKKSVLPIRFSFFNNSQ